MHPLGGAERTLDEQLKLFQLVAVVLDPYTYESAWLLETATRILHHFSGADCRTAFVVTTDEDGAKAFLGPLTESTMVFCDPDRHFVKAIGATTLPAFVHLDHTRSVVGLAQGWDPHQWAPIAHALATTMSWTAPPIPWTGDPSPYEGSPSGV